MLACSRARVASSDAPAATLVAARADDGGAQLDDRADDAGAGGFETVRHEDCAQGELCAVYPPLPLDHVARLVPAAGATWVVGAYDRAARFDAHGWTVVKRASVPADVLASDAGVPQVLGLPTTPRPPLHEPPGLSFVVTRSPSDVWAWGDTLLAHHDGSRWSSSELWRSTANVNAAYASVWSSGPNDVWLTVARTAPGMDDHQLVHWDGHTFDAFARRSPAEGDGASAVGAPPDMRNVDAVAGLASNAVVAAGWFGSALPHRFAWMRFDGKTWSEDPAGAVRADGRFMLPRAIFSNGDAIGSADDLVAKWSNGAWTPIVRADVAPPVKIGPSTPYSAFVDTRLKAVAVVSATDVWAAGNEVFHWDGKRATKVAGWRPPGARPNSVYVRAIAASTGDGVWVVTSPVDEAPGVPEVARFDGKQWTRSPLPFASDVRPYAIAVGEGEAWVVGSGGAAARWDGTAWTSISTGTTRDLYGVGIESNYVWVAASGAVLRRSR